MRKENSTLSKKLKQYSALAGTMLASTGLANAQVIYTDIDPDSVFAGSTPFPGDISLIDMNNDGIFDFEFKAFKSTYTHGVGLIPYPATTSNPNGIVGTLGAINGYPFGYISALQLNNIIDANQSFFSMAILFASGSNSYFPIMVSGSSGNEIGNWIGVTDHYIGIRFTDGSNLHYGWIRCDAASDGSSVTIKEYAYQATPDAPLFAGQGSPLGITPVEHKNNFNIFGYDGVANVFVNDGDLNDATVTVTNMLGETVVKQVLTDRSTLLDLNQFAKGIYLVTIQRGGEIFSKKISFR